MPSSLPKQLTPIWQVGLTAKGLGGVAATEDVVIVSDRELLDSLDCFRCLRASNGEEIWRVAYPAKGNLDYGNSPRATPLIHDGRVFLHGAFGHLVCVDLKSGETLWEINIRDQFGADDERPWGTCGSPLIVDGKLIINPGAKEASLVALNPKSGEAIWKTPGPSASYGSFIAATLGGKLQIVGFDRESLGGWDPATGKRLWTLAPEVEAKFKVSTPVVLDGKLLIALENNGTSLYAFGADGKIQPRPIGYHRDLSPDSHTPVVVGSRVFGVWSRLFCLDASNKLKEIYDSEDKAFATYCALIASDDRVMAITTAGELILFDAKANEFKPIARCTTVADEAGMYAHPALVGNRLYLRSSSAILCVDLAPGK